MDGSWPGNRPLEDWGKLMSNVPGATAILDRFLHHAEIIAITGKSYRPSTFSCSPHHPYIRDRPIGNQGFNLFSTSVHVDATPGPVHASRAISYPARAS